MKVSTENDNNFGYEKITIVVDNMPLTFVKLEFRTSFEKLLNKKWYVGGGDDISFNSAIFVLSHCF
jgi:hypothetical protein